MGILSDWQIMRDVTIEPKPSKEQTAKGVISHGYSSYGVDVRVGYKFLVFTPALCAEVDPKNFDPRAFVEIDLTPTRHSWSRALNTSYRCRNCKELAEGDGTALPFEPFASEACPAGVEKPNFVRIPPNSFALAESLETITVPRDCLALCACKSTYARCGVVIPTTILEPEWTGTVTLEVANTTPLPARVYAGEGICQVLFFRTDGQSEAVRHSLHKFLDTFSARSGDVRAANAYDYLRCALEGSNCQTSYADRRGRYQSQDKLTLPFVEGK